MDIYKKTIELCKIYNIIPKRSKGQNFLINEEVFNKIVKVADLKKDDVVLEVGPGLGFLTVKLAQKVKQVIAVELDDKLARVLKTGLEAKGVGNVEVVNESVLQLSIADLRLPIYKIVANLPYNITSIFLRKFLEADNKPELMVLMLQKEVAERIVAGRGKMSLLAVSVQFYSEPKIIEYVGKENFWPKPEVDSVVMKLRVKKEAELPTCASPLASARRVGSSASQTKNFFRMVKIGFSAKRKMLKNNLAGGYKITQVEVAKKLENQGFYAKIRAQELSVDDWLKLFGEFK